MSNCKQCGNPVDWKRVDGRWLCFDAGTDADHWDSCSKARTARIIATGEYVDTEKSAYYRTRLKKSGVHMMRETSGSIRGIYFTQSGQCQDCVPPWEMCPRLKGCPDGIAGV